MPDMQDVIDFWLGDVGEDGWYAAVPEVDAKIIARFSALWESARGGGLDGWCATPHGTFAFLILADQFPRNMFRGDARSFATDVAARQAARRAIARGDDLLLGEPERVFFYMPFEHSEHLADQDWAVELMEHRLPRTGAGFAVHARAHREIIRRFGRFPFRNAALGRPSTAAEEDFLKSGGYGAVVRELGG